MDLDEELDAHKSKGNPLFLKMKEKVGVVGTSADPE